MIYTVEWRTSYTHKLPPRLCVRLRTPFTPAHQRPGLSTGPTSPLNHSTQQSERSPSRSGTITA